MLQQLRALPAFMRAAIAAIAGAIAGALIFGAFRRGMTPTQRKEVALFGGAAVAVIVWLLLLPTAAEEAAIAQGPAVSINYPVHPGDEYWLQFPGTNIPPIDLTILSHPINPPQSQTNCGCAARMDRWHDFIMQLWDQLDALPGG